MSDVFISYAREDRARIERLSAALQAEGLSVWWDRQIVGGAEFSKDIERELGAAKAVIVAWSKAAVESRWVKDEAGIAAQAGKLVTVSLDGTGPPIGFRQFHAVDCAGDDAATFAEIKRAIVAKLSGAPPAAATVPLRGLLAKWRRSPVLPLVVAATLAAMVAGAFVLKPAIKEAPLDGHRAEKKAAAQSLVAKPAKAAGVGLAVLPFANFSSDPEQEFFADGLTEEILNWLGNVEGLRVPGRTTSFQFKGKAEDLRAIGQALNVAYVLEGSVRRSGEKLRITAQLIDAKSGDHLWSEAYDRTLADIFDIQTEIARTVVTELLGKIPETGIANPAAVGDVDPKAHELYLEGRALWAARHGSAALQKFRQAVAADPRHAFAQAYIAVIVANFVANDGSLPGIDNPDAMITKALAEAVRLKPNAADVLFANAWVAEMRGGVAPGSSIPDRSTIDAYQAAVRANPRHVEALHALARAEPSPEKQIALYERILEIDPGHAAARGNLGRAVMRIGDRAKAAFLLRQGMVVAPDSRSLWAADAKVLGNLAISGEAALDWGAVDRSDDLGWIAAPLLADLGAFEEARFLYMKAATGNPNWRGFYRAAVAVLDGDAAAELAAAEEFHASAPSRYSAWALANALIGTGDYARAYDVIALRRPDIAGARIEQAFHSFDEFADIEFVTAAHALDLAGRRDEARPLWKGALARAKAAPMTAGWGWTDFLYLALLESRVGDTAEAVKSFQAAYDAGFRYLASYACSDCMDDGFSAEHGLFAPLVAIPENKALVERIKAENAAALKDFNNKYGILDRVRGMMAAEAAQARD